MIPHRYTFSYYSILVITGQLQLTTIFLIPRTIISYCFPYSPNYSFLLLPIFPEPLSPIVSHIPQAMFSYYSPYSLMPGRNPWLLPNHAFLLFLLFSAVPHNTRFPRDYYIGAPCAAVRLRARNVEQFYKLGGILLEYALEPYVFISF